MKLKPAHPGEDAQTFYETLAAIISAQINAGVPLQEVIAVLSHTTGQLSGILSDQFEVLETDALNMVRKNVEIGRLEYFNPDVKQATQPPQKGSKIQ